MTREEKQIEYNQHCQLALLAHVRFQSETQSIQNNMDDVFCFHSMFVAARFQLWKHAIAGRRRLLSLAVTGITSEEVRSRVEFERFEFGNTVLDWEQINNRSDTTQ